MVFLKNLQKDIAAFVYLNLILMIFRIIFIYLFSYQLVSITEQEIFMTLWYGFRLSLKTAGMLTMIGSLLATIPNLFLKNWPADFLRKLWHGFCVFLITLAFFARIPYYTIFNSGYNLMLVNGAKDDWQAIYATAVKQYQLYPRLAGIFIVTCILVYILYKILGMPTWKPKTHKKLVVTLAVIILLPFIYFVRFAGGYNFGSSIYWENAVRMKSNLLNEAILDDGQALYRTWTMSQRLANSTKVNSITLTELQKDIKILGGNVQAKTIETSFLRTAKGEYLAKQPRQVVVIFGENYALWPFLDRYKDLGLVSKGQGLINSGKAAYIPNFLANGNGTIGSLQGLISGLAGEGLYENYESETYKSHYATGIGNAMKELGYKTVFWYGGFSSWQDIRKFALAQGFDEFYGAENMTENQADVWGISDEDLFEHISAYMLAHDNTKTFNFVLTTSNHPPFALDVDSKGFKRDQVLSKLPDSIGKDKTTIDQLGHIWYADQTAGNFIERTEKEYPDALFVVTGDHAERFNFAKEETLQALSSIPCIVYGNGVHENWFAKDATGSHMQITPTLIEILAPKGYKYSSILPSLFADFPISFNPRLWGYGLHMGELNSLNTAQISEKEKEQVAEVSTAARGISVWRVKRGNIIE